VVIAHDNVLSCCINVLGEGHAYDLLPPIIPPEASRPDDTLPLPRSLPTPATTPAGVMSNSSPPHPHLHTRRATPSLQRFFAWCENRGLTLTGIRPYDVAGYVGSYSGAAAAKRPPLSAPSVKQELAAIRMLFNCWSPGKSCR